MYKEVLQSIKGIDTVAVVALIVFIFSFIVIAVSIFKMDKNHAKKMAQLPLEPENNSQKLEGE